MMAKEVGRSTRAGCLLRRGVLALLIACGVGLAQAPASRADSAPASRADRPAPAPPPVPTPAPAAAPVPAPHPAPPPRVLRSPEQAFGHACGADTKLLAWQQIVDYFRETASISDRVRVDEIGKSTLGK